ncbi:hypothetical protein BJY52DRAFT_1413833 [Lactarius psammicola]|nr:hypothetical protein BJY52DRAFT_1413833 [Lactarius psammicola]
MERPCSTWRSASRLLPSARVSRKASNSTLGQNSGTRASSRRRQGKAVVNLCNTNRVIQNAHSTPIKLVLLWLNYNPIEVASSFPARLHPPDQLAPYDSMADRRNLHVAGDDQQDAHQEGDPQPVGNVAMQEMQYPRHIDAPNYNVAHYHPPQPPYTEVPNVHMHRDVGVAEAVPARAHPFAPEVQENYDGFFGHDAQFPAADPPEAFPDVLPHPAPRTNMPPANGLRILASRYLNNAGTHVNMLRIEPGPGGRFELAFAVESVILATAHGVRASEEKRVDFWCTCEQWDAGKEHRQTCLPTPDAESVTVHNLRPELFIIILGQSRFVMAPPLNSAWARSGAEIAHLQLCKVVVISMRLWCTGIIRYYETRLRVKDRCLKRRHWVVWTNFCTSLNFLDEILLF